MQELIQITENDGEQVVSARELHQFLEVGRDFTTWCKSMFKYGFEEETDFSPIWGRSANGRPSVDYALKLDTAKEISMLQRSEKGQQARRYFIEIEKKYKNLSPAEQLVESAKHLLKQEKKIAEHDNRILELEAANNHDPNYYTVTGYGTIQGVAVTRPEAQRLGKVATWYCKSNGYKIDKTKHPLWGMVNMYPKKALRVVFNNFLG